MSMVMDARLLAKLVEEAGDFAVPPGHIVPRVHKPNSTVFLRDFVGHNQPCVATGLLDDKDEWPAMQKWQDHRGLCAGLDDGRQVVSVDATPSGFGDAVIRHPVDNELVFVQPEKRRMPIGDFLTQLEENESNDGHNSINDDSVDTDVLYLSHQNDNLRVEMDALLSDVAGEGLPLAIEAFGNAPDAINLWIGDARAVSTMHRDNYENMYCVVKGEKVFDLLPPCCAPLLPMVEVRNGTYSKWQQQQQTDGKEADTRDVDKKAWVVELDADSSSTMWTRFDIDNESIGVGVDAVSSNLKEEERGDVQVEAVEARAMLKSMVCRVHVRAGEVLYLPAMWYHRVTQTELTIAVNYWHDMHFGDRWVYQSVIDRLCGVTTDLGDNNSIENETEEGETGDVNRIE